MSIRLSSRVWDMDIRPQGKKLVLLAFADAANEDGLTWIALESKRGKQSICRKVSASIRSVQSHVAQLEAEGFLERNETIGRGCVWRVHATPAKFAGVTNTTPAESAPPPAESAGEPSINRQEKKKTGERFLPISEKCPLLTRPLPSDVSLEQWEAFLDMRASTAKPVRAYVAQVLLRKLDKIAQAGWHAGDVLDRSTVNTWPDVYEPEAGRVTGVRRVVSGSVAEPVGMSDDDRAELSRIAQIEDVGRMLQERREFMTRVEHRKAPDAFGVLISELPLRPPLEGARHG